jgi:hypothetical protein
MTQQQQQALLIPLLGDECYDVNDTKAQESSPHSDNNKDEDHVNQVDLIFPYNFLVVWVVMPAFLFIQFGFAFSIHQHDHHEMTTMASVSWSTVNWNIFLFVVTVWLYRWACIDSCITNSVLLLLPEIMTNIVLAILVFDIHKIAAAFVALMVSIQLMSILALAATIHCIIFFHHSDKNVVEAQEEEENAYLSMEKQVEILLV